MNKKQLIILWCMGIILSIVAICKGFYDTPYRHFLPKTGVSYYFYGQIIGIVIPVLIIGSILIYTLRNHK